MLETVYIDYFIPHNIIYVNFIITTEYDQTLENRSQERLLVMGREWRGGVKYFVNEKSEISTNYDYFLKGFWFEEGQGEEL